MKSFKTLNTKQVSAIHSRPLSNYTIHGVSNLSCALHCKRSAVSATIQHNEPLWSESTPAVSTSR